jgi:hypothetical protein
VPLGVFVKRNNLLISEGSNSNAELGSHPLPLKYDGFGSCGSPSFEPRLGQYVIAKVFYSSPS